jgi:hypothetical protein
MDVILKTVSKPTVMMMFVAIVVNCPSQAVLVKHSTVAGKLPVPTLSPKAAQTCRVATCRPTRLPSS